MFTGRHVCVHLVNLVLLAYTVCFVECIKVLRKQPSLLLSITTQSSTPTTSTNNFVNTSRFYLYQLSLTSACHYGSPVELLYASLASFLGRLSWSLFFSEHQGGWPSVSIPCFLCAKQVLTCSRNDEISKMVLTMPNTVAPRPPRCVNYYLNCVKKLSNAVKGAHQVETTVFCACDNANTKCNPYCKDSGNHNYDDIPAEFNCALNVLVHL